MENLDSGAPAAPISPAMRARLRMWIAVCVAIGTYGWLVFITTFRYPGKIGLDWNTPGTDWMVFYLAGKDLLAGRLQDLLDPATLSHDLNRIFGAYLSTPLTFRPWLYPPSFLLVVFPFCLMPFRVSYVVFLITTFAFLCFPVVTLYRRRLDRQLLFGSLLLNPATSITAVQGQNSFLTSGLLVFAIRLTHGMPILAGVCYGMLSYKPQLCLMVPVALIAERRWTVVGSALATIACLVAASTAIVGVGPWHSWYTFMTNPPPQFVEGNLLSGVSVYTDGLLLGLPSRVALSIQLLFTTAAGYCVWRTFSAKAPLIQRLGVLLSATVLAAPYAAMYDLLPLAIAATLMLKQSAEQASTGALAVMIGAIAWIAPQINPPLANPLGFLTPFLCLFVMRSFMKTGRRGESMAPGVA